MKALKQTYTPTLLAEPKAHSMSMSLVVYGILFVAWVFVQLTS